MTDTRTARTALTPLLVAASLISVLALAACAVTLPSEPPGVTGTVTGLVAGDGRPASFLVEGANPQPSGAVSDKAQVTIAPATMFFGADGKPAPLELVARIARGTKVRVWFQGAVAESYPVQGSARAVQVIGE